MVDAGQKGGGEGGMVACMPVVLRGGDREHVEGDVGRDGEGGGGRCLQ
jgi:hypothetical protein